MPRSPFSSSVTFRIPPRRSALLPHLIKAERTFAESYVGDIQVWEPNASRLQIAGLRELNGRIDVAPKKRRAMDMPYCRSITFNDLETVTNNSETDGGGIGVRGGELSVLGSVEFPVLQSVAKKIVVSGHPHLKRVVFGAVEQFEILSLADNPELVDVQLPAGFAGHTKLVNLWGCALPEAKVNELILLFAPLQTAKLLIHGGTNAAPTGEALEVANTKSWRHN